MMLKIATRAFGRVCRRPIALSANLRMNKIDADLVNYVNDQLDNDIKERTISSIKGWSSVSQDGSIGTMTKESAGETVTVRFDTNGTMPKTEDQDALEDAGREVLCFPDMEVIVERPGKKTMFFNCTLEDNRGSNPEDEEDPFEIVSLSVANKADEEPYVLNMDVMEDDFYDGMYQFLASRGIDDAFCEELVNITTDIESNNYRQLLKDMKDFVMS